MSEPTRLEALYEDLLDNRSTQQGAWLTGRTERTQEARDSFMDAIRALVREEDMILGEIESLGGEDPEL